MSHQRQQIAIHDAQGLPAVLPILDAVLLNYCERVGKNAGAS